MTAEERGCGLVLGHEHFARLDETDDSLFYGIPRLVAHIDAGARAALAAFFAERLRARGVVLDLMSSCVSHLPEPVPYRQVVGLGMNAVELAANTQLTGALVHDLNREARLPFADAVFDAVLITVSIQYLTRPIAVLEEVARVLCPRGILAVSYSNRLFPTKAVAVWRALGDRERARLIGHYMATAGGFEGPEFEDRTPRTGKPADPLYVIWARRADPG